MPRQPSKAQRKMVREIVQNELDEELENKVAVIGDISEKFDTAAIPGGDVAGSSNYIKIFPSITQGAGQYNKRVGNEIRLKHLDIKMLMNYVDAAGSGSYKDQSLGVRVMILRQKDNNDQIGFIADSQAAKLLENGEISTAGPAAFSGTTINLLQKINREQFSVRYDKVFYVDRAREFNTGANTYVFNRPPRPTVMSYRLSFGKRGLKLTYSNGDANNPTNFPYVMVVGYASTMDGSAPSNNILEYTYTANASYTDS